MRLREYTDPGSIHSIEMILHGDLEPLTLNVSVRFIGRVPSGFGIGACITEESPDKRQRWERFYQQVLTGEERAVGEAVGEQVIATARSMSPSIQAHLEAHGFTLVLARDNGEVLSLLRPDTPEVVLCDLYDPQLSGAELCSRIKRQPAYAKVAVILVTENKTAGDFLTGLNAGAAYVISKPFSAEFCASRVIAAARQTAPYTEPAGGPDRVPQQGTGTAFGAEVQYLHAPSVLPSYLVRAMDRVSDALFITKLAARHGLRKYKGWLTG